MVEFGGDGGIVLDGGGGLRVVPSELAPILKEGATGELTVTLSAEPPEAVLVALAASDEDLLGVTPDALIFQPADWDRPQTIALAAQLDDDASDEEIELRLTSTSLADPTAVAVTIDDADEIAI